MECFAKEVILMAKGFPNKNSAYISGKNVDRDTPKPKVIKGKDLRSK
jgi:hypothetical protein